MSRTLQITLVVFALIICVSLLVYGFGAKKIASTLPTGQQTLTGTLIPAELSLSRRGTHALEVDGEKVVFVESASVNLRSYELTEVGLSGTYQKNTLPDDLPVFVVTQVRPIEVPAASKDFPPVGLTLRVPLDWNTQIFDDGVTFSLTGSTTPLLRITRSAFTQLPAGTPMIVAGQDAVRSSDAQGSIVHVLTNRGILTFTWSATASDTELNAGFAQLLRTAIIRASSSSPRTQTGSQTVSRSSLMGGSAASGAKQQPCGGPNGVLCPSGTYCNVLDQESGIGLCTSL